MSKNPPYIADYELLRPIGRGAFGEVWLARAVTGQYRAVKVLQSHELPTRRAFQREFEGVVRYEPFSRTQRNLVHILHVGRSADGQSFWYVMELADDASRGNANLPGQGQGVGPLAEEGAIASYKPCTLRSVLRSRGQLPVEECVSVGLGIAEAAAYLHANELVHRDIKPSNVIFVNGIAKLADIGLVTTSEEVPSFVGTAGYIPPDGAGTRAADIYALGKVLYEMATGRSIQDFPRLPEDFTTAADRRALVDLNEIVVRAAENNARRRYARMEDLRSDLLLLGAGRPARRWRRLERRLKVALRAGAVVAGIAFVSIGLGIWANHERLRAVAAERELSTRFIEQQLTLARATRLTGVPGQRTRSLSVIREAARQTNNLALRNEAVAAFALPDVRHWRTIPGGRMVFDTLLRRYATNAPNGDLFVRSVENDRLLAHLSTASVSAPAAERGGLAAFDFSASGDYVCATYSNRLFSVWQVGPPPTVQNDTKPGSSSNRHPEPALPRIITLAGAPAGLHRLAGGGQLAAIQGYSGTIDVFDLEACRHVRAIEGPFTNALAFSSDGSRFASVSGDSFTVRDLASGVVLQSFTNRTTGLDSLIWHPDSRQLLTIDGGRDLRLWNLETGGDPGTLRGHEAEVIQAAFDATGEWLLSASWDNQTVLWNAARQKVALRLAAAGNALHFSADARRFAWHTWDDRQWEIFQMTPPTEVTWLEQHPGQEGPTGLRSLWGAAFLNEEVIAGPGNAGFSVWQPPEAYASVLAKTGLERPLIAVPGCSLFSSGDHGLRRWPITEDRARSDLYLGPPQRLSPLSLGATREFAASADGRRLAFVTPRRQLFLLTETEPAACRELTNGSVLGIAMDPSGRFVAASLRNAALGIWDAGSGSIVTNLPCPDALTCSVSPDGRWLSAATTASFLIWRVTDWQRVAEISRTAVSSPAHAWSRDSQVFLVHDVDFAVRLLRAGTWEELCSLPAPEMMREILVSPDGTQAALAGEKAGIELWDLGRLRLRLRDLKLDWIGPPNLASRQPSTNRWKLRLDSGSD